MPYKLTYLVSIPRTGALFWSLSSIGCAPRVRTVEIRPTLSHPLLCHTMARPGGARVLSFFIMKLEREDNRDRYTWPAIVFTGSHCSAA